MSIFGFKFNKAKTSPNNESTSNNSWDSLGDSDDIPDLSDLEITSASAPRHHNTVSPNENKKETIEQSDNDKRFEDFKKALLKDPTSNEHKEHIELLQKNGFHIEEEELSDYEKSLLDDVELRKRYEQEKSDAEALEEIDHTITKMGKRAVEIAKEDATSPRKPWNRYTSKKQ
jgi:hypothetical protein